MQRFLQWHSAEPVNVEHHLYEKVNPSKLLLNWKCQDEHPAVISMRISGA